MRLGILLPNMSFLSGSLSMHRYAEELIDNYVDKVLTYEECKTYKGDAIICLNGRPDLLENCPPKEFKGLTIVHLQDHVFQTEKTSQVLKDNKVDYVMCYNRHDKHDPFFKALYSNYIGKVIPVPFGYNDKRFKQKKAFDKRINKVVALGSVNPVSDPLCIDDIKVYAWFFNHEEFTHKWRRQLVVEKNMLSEEMDSLLPEFPQTKDFDYDIVKVYNDYKMFTSGESIMNYPSVKTFEGIACGSVLVCSNHSCYKDLGFKDGVNCIMHKAYDTFDFKKAVNYYQNRPNKLQTISEYGKWFVETNYSPKIIAQKLFNNIEQKWIHKK